MSLNRRHFMLALALSVLAHLAFVAGSEVSLPDLLPGKDDEVVATKAGGNVPKVRLSARKEKTERDKAAVAAGIPTLTIVHAEPTVRAVASGTGAPRKAKKQKPKKTDVIASATAPTIPTEAAPDSVPPPPEETAAATTTSNPEEGNRSTPPAPTEAPVFPDSGRALFKANLYGIPLDLTQTWLFTDNRYAIESNASKFGIKFGSSSEGHITSTGLQPDRFRTYVNSRSSPKTEAIFTYGPPTLLLGKPGSQVTVPLPAGTQDLFSFSYHLAITFSGNESVSLPVTTGTALYDLRFSLTGEEILVLPAGKIRTFHLKGTRQRIGSGNVQDGYEVWLAPEFSNYPVKMRGPDSKGRILELSLKTLEFSGKTMIGKDLPPEKDADPAELPTELQQHIKKDTIPTSP